MGQQIINTRIRNKYDTLNNWSTKNPVLLQGEVAFVKVMTEQKDQNTGNVINVPAYLAKVGDGETAFNSLAWLSAKAADVYPWAKTENAEDVSITTEDGTKTVKAWFEAIYDWQENFQGNYTQGQEAMAQLIESKINELDSTVTDVTSDGSGKVVRSVVQKDGKVTVQTTTLLEGDIPSLAASKIKTTGTNTLDVTLEAINGQIDNIKTEIAGGVHFRGTVAAAPTSAAVTVTAGGKSTAITAIAGDVVIWAEKGIEYIYNGTAWEELGDVTRIGALETAIDNLDYSSTDAGANKFVTNVTQTNGRITATFARPTAVDVSYGNTTVSDTLEDHEGRIGDAEDKLDGISTTVSDAITNAINALDFTAPTASGDTISFIDTVSQTNGVITATKKNISAASTTSAGIVKLNNTTDSTSTTEAATANVVKTVNAVATDAQGRVAAVEGDYVRIAGDTDNKKLYYGKDGTNEIIFCCGDANV